MTKLDFLVRVLDARTGVVETIIIKSTYVPPINSNVGSLWHEHGGKSIHETLGTVPGFVSYEEQREWEALLLAETP